MEIDINDGYVLAKLEEINKALEKQTELLETLEKRVSRLEQIEIRKTATWKAIQIIGYILIALLSWKAGSGSFSDLLAVLK